MHTSCRSEWSYLCLVIWTKSFMGGGWHCNYSNKLQAPGDTESWTLCWTWVELDREWPGAELVNFVWPSYDKHTCLKKLEAQSENKNLFWLWHTLYSWCHFLPQSCLDPRSWHSFCRPTRWSRGWQPRGISASRRDSMSVSYTALTSLITYIMSFSTIACPSILLINSRAMFKLDHLQKKNTKFIKTHKNTCLHLFKVTSNHTSDQRHQVHMVLLTVFIV